MKVLRTSRNAIFATLAAALLFAAAMPGEAAAYSGVWYDHTGRSAVLITPCGSGLCGRVVWLKNKGHSAACGVAIIGGGQKVGNSYDNGWIYDPEKGKKYNVELTLLSSSSLKVMGYAGSKFLSKTMMWHRAPSNLERCQRGFEQPN